MMKFQFDETALPKIKNLEQRKYFNGVCVPSLICSTTGQKKASAI